MSLKIYFSLLISLISLQLKANATSIKGKVIDAKTGDPLIGATVIIKDNNLHAIAGMDGSYLIQNVEPGTYQITAEYLGYQTNEQLITVQSDQKEIVVDFMMLDEVKEVQVTVKEKLDKESEKAALKSEKNADNVTNSISAKTIQLLPDITVANVLQRMSGITVERSSNGDGRYAIIRGMDQRYNYTMINGVKIPSPDNKYRFVPMDIFPAEIIERLEVTKSLTPNMEGDATGGAMNLILKSAPDKLLINANLGTGYNQMFIDRKYSKFDINSVNYKSPAQIHGNDFIATPNDFTYGNLTYKNITPAPNLLGGLSLGNRFFNKKLGVIISGSYQNTYRGANSTYFRPNSQPNIGNVSTFEEIYIRQYSTQQIRSGVHSKIDYVFSPKNKISLYNVYMQMNEYQTRHTVDTTIGIGSNSSNKNVYIYDRSRVQIQSIFNSTLQGEHWLLPSLKINWSAVYSIAKNNLPDWSEVSTAHTVDKGENGTLIENPANLNSLVRRWTHNSDRDKTVYYNISWSPTLIKNALEKISISDFEISGGGLFRHKERSNYYTEYNFVILSAGGMNAVYDGNLTPDKLKFQSADAAKGSPINPNTYTASENILANYGQMKFLVKQKLQVVGGARVENTSQSFQTVMPANYILGNAGSITYMDLLPSLNLKYMLNKKQNLRLTYFKSITRPGFFEIIPYTLQGEIFDEQGNPYLKHTRTDNYDLRYEIFPKGNDQLLLGVFYKNIINPIEIGFVKTGTSAVAVKPMNFGNAVNYGFEFVLTKFFGRIGISTNYTYTSSNITTNKAYYIGGKTGDSTVTQRRPLQGQSKNIGNLSLLYKNSDLGLDMQLAFVYTGRKITQVSMYQNLDYWQRGTSQLDFSIEKRIRKKFSLYCKITNILNTPVIVEIMQPNIYRTGAQMLPDQTRNDRILVQKDYYKQNYLFGIRYKF